MNKSVALALGAIAVAAVVLPLRFGLAWIIGPGLVLGALALSGLVRDYGAEEKVDPFLSQHAVKLLVVAGVMCVMGVGGAVRNCAAKPMYEPLGEGAGGERDFIRERVRPAAPDASR